MKKLIIFLVLVICFIPNSYAEDVATYFGATVTGCKNIGDTNVFLNNPNDYTTIKDGYVYLPSGCKSLPNQFKYLKVVNGAIEEMSQQEKSVVDAAEAQAVADAETARLSLLDTKISDSKVADFTMTKVDTAIDNIANLADAKIFLKRLCRYIAKNGA